MHFLVKGLFLDIPTHLHWNQIIFGRPRAKDMLEKLFSETLCRIDSNDLAFFLHIYLLTYLLILMCSGDTAGISARDRHRDGSSWWAYPINVYRRRFGPSSVSRGHTALRILGKRRTTTHHRGMVTRQMDFANLCKSHACNRTYQIITTAMFTWAFGWSLSNWNPGRTGPPGCLSLARWAG